jgi:hypothetical protein
LIGPNGTPEFLDNVAISKWFSKINQYLANDLDGSEDKRDNSVHAVLHAEYASPWPAPIFFDNYWPGDNDFLYDDDDFWAHVKYMRGDIVLLKSMGQIDRNNQSTGLPGLGGKAPNSVHFADEYAHIGLWDREVRHIVLFVEALGWLQSNTPWIEETLVHELGHYAGLLNHAHKGKNTDSPVKFAGTDLKVAYPDRIMSYSDVDVYYGQDTPEPKEKASPIDKAFFEGKWKFPSKKPKKGFECCGHEYEDPNQ